MPTPTISLDRTIVFLKVTITSMVSRRSAGPFILGMKVPDGHVFTQPWPPARPNSKQRDHRIYYQYKADRGRRTLRGIDEQVAKAAKAVAGLGSSGTGSSPSTAP